MKNFSENWAQSPELAQVKLVYQTKGDLSSNPVLCHPEDVHIYLLDIWDSDRIELQEEFCVLLLNNSLRVLGWHRLSTGSKTATVVDISHLIALTVLSNANSVVIAHNHLSGLQPSSADLKLTKRIHSALKIIGVTLQDHLIINRESYYSFRDHGMIGNHALQ